MVNTFVTVTPQDPVSPYRGCAILLDPKRLWKQCLEAMQILTILQQLHLIAKICGYDPCPPCAKPGEDDSELFLKRGAWVKEVRKKYLDLPTRLLFRSGQNEVFEWLNKDALPSRVSSTDTYVINPDDTVTVWINESTNVKSSFAKRGTLIDPQHTTYDMSAGKRFRTRSPYLFSRDQVALEEDVIVTLGFSSHPVVKMWVGYETSLSSYINDHIDEHLSRGGKCKASKYFLPADVPIGPWWVVDCKHVIRSHRAALCRKNPEWYIPRFFKYTMLPTTDFLNTGYIWCCNMTRNEIVCMVTNPKEVDLKSVSTPITDASSNPQIFEEIQKFLREYYQYTGSRRLNYNGTIKV